MIFEKEDIKSVTLLSFEEYRDNKEIIPAVNSWWWLRTPGSFKKNAAYVFIDAEAHTEGYKVGSTAGVRPLIIVDAAKAKEIKVGEKVMIGKYAATVLDDKSCLIDECVTRRKFDDVTNDYEVSELKSFLESPSFMELIFD